jgi:hypothetical protein
MPKDLYSYAYYAATYALHNITADTSASAAVGYEELLEEESGSEKYPQATDPTLMGW